MTRDEAKRLLADYIDYDKECPHFYEMEEACKVALKALSYDDAKYHEEHGEVVVDEEIWEDANKAFLYEQTQRSMLEDIRAEIEDYVCNKETDTVKAQGMLNALGIMERYMKEPRQDLQQAAEKIIEQTNKWFEEGDRE